MTGALFSFGQRTGLWKARQLSKCLVKRAGGVDSSVTPIAAVELRIVSRLLTLAWQIGVTPEQERELGPLEQL